MMNPMPLGLRHAGVMPLLPNRTERWTLALFFLCYLTSCGIAQWLAIVPGTGISLWMPGGFYLAVLLVSRRAIWPLLLIAAALAELIATVMWFHNPLPLAFTLHLGNATAAVGGALLVRRLSGLAVFQLRTLRDVLILLLVGALAASTLSAAVGAITLHQAQGQPLSKAWWLWWLGDASGSLISAPLVLIAYHSRSGWKRPSTARLLEAAFLGVVLLAVSAISLGGYLPFAYIVTPVLVWAAVRFQFVGAACAILVLTLMTAYLTVTGSSPFAGTPATQAWHSMMLKLFLAVSSILAMCVAAVSSELEHAALSLRLANGELEQRVRQRTSELDQAARHKDVLLALIAHELRSPLSAILLGAEFLKRAPGDPEKVRGVQKLVERQGGLLKRLIEDLLDISAINEGKLALQHARVNLAAVAEQSLESCRARIEARKHRVALAGLDAPVWVHGDAERLVQCVSNLLDNAAKYTEPGGRIEISLSCSGGTNGPRAILRIADTGIGIDPSRREDVFDLFYRVHLSPTASASSPGLGLGLALVKRLIEMQGGQVGVDSDGLGCGSTFWMQMPLADQGISQPGSGLEPSNADEHA